MVTNQARSEPLLAGLLAVQAAFQAGLAAGAPWGRMSYGGKYERRLPSKYRRVSAVAAGGYAALAAVAAAGNGSAAVRRNVFTGVAAFMGVGVVLNLASPPLERLWSPYCAVTALAAMRARPVRS